MSFPDVILAGGGIIGLSTALELAKSGMRVTVLERARAMSEASWAAAGMLAAHDPENPAALQDFSDFSLQLYPGYLASLEKLSGLRIPLRTSGTLQGSGLGSGQGSGQVPEQVPEKGHHFSSSLSPEEIASHLPDLHAEGRSFLWLEEHSLAPRDICAALPKAAQAAGVQIIEHAPVLSLHSTPSGVTVATADARYSARHFINCCGAWAGSISNLPAIEPRKGQMITVQLPPEVKLPCVVRTPELYLVPRGDGRVVIGATVERTGFDKSVLEATVQTLLDDAAVLWPPIRDGKLVESWAGLRPGSSDGLPVIGPSGEPHQWAATGHFRNGILLAPATARVMRQLLLGEAPSLDLHAFRCDRFAAASVS